MHNRLLACPFCEALIPLDALTCPKCHKVLDAIEFPEEG